MPKRGRNYSAELGRPDLTHGGTHGAKAGKTTVGTCVSKSIVQDYRDASLPNCCCLHLMVSEIGKSETTISGGRVNISPKLRAIH